MSAGGVVSGANDAARAMDRMGRQAEKTARDLSALKGIAIGAVFAKGISMAADALMSAGRAAASYAAGVANAVDQTNDLAQRLGMGVESLQALQMAAKLSGVDDATGALQKLTVAIGNASESGKTEAFTKLGLDFAKLEAMAPEEQFRAVQAAIAALPTPAEKAAAAVAIFGKSGVELLPLMNQNLAEVEERMRRLGAIVGDDQVEAIGSMNDSLDMVKATFDGIIGNVEGNLAPVVESLANDFLAFVEEWNAMSGGTGIADSISEGLLDIAEYFAGVFDNAMASFDGFGVTLSQVGAVFEFVGNVFTMVAETLRAAFNGFQVAGNILALGLGKFLEGLGSWVSSDLEQVGKDMAANAQREGDKNFKEAMQAGSNAVAAGNRAIFGGNAAQGASGPATRAVQSARARMTPEERERRKSERDAKASQDKAAREAAAADAKAAREEEQRRKALEKAEEKRASEIGRMQERVSDASKFREEAASALGTKSNEALKANDIRSSEGMSQFLALATGREDPALEEYRKQTAKLNEIKAELAALQQQPVEVLGVAA